MWGNEENNRGREKEGGIGRRAYVGREILAVSLLGKAFFDLAPSELPMGSEFGGERGHDYGEGLEEQADDGVGSCDLKYSRELDRLEYIPGSHFIIS